MSLLPKGALSAVIRVLEFGATKYQENNWKHVPDAKTRYYDAMQRHIDAWWNGEQKDPETGEHHLAHATCCAMFLMWFDFNGYRNAPVTPQAILDAQPSKDMRMVEKCCTEQKRRIDAVDQFLYRLKKTRFVNNANIELKNRIVSDLEAALRGESK